VRWALLFTAASLLVLSAPNVLASTAGSPFYFVPSPTTECQNVAGCVAAVGPWVAVPAKGEATFLFGCPTIHGYIVDGTDARASSTDIRVWYDGQLGAPLAYPPSSATNGAILIFHAVSNVGRAGFFQPILGCVSLRQAGKSSTLSDRPGWPGPTRFTAGVQVAQTLRLLEPEATSLPGTNPAPPIEPHAILSTIQPQTGPNRSVPATASTCVTGQRLVGNWSAVAFLTSGPPALVYASAVRITEVDLGDTVQPRVAVTRAIPYQSEAQIGALCET
jgi:hypothetical protein